MLNDRQIEIFEALFRTGNITQAAGELYISRQALSTDLAKIEGLVGGRLFERTTSGIEPTPAAVKLHDLCAKQKSLWQQYLDEVRGQKTIRNLNFGRLLMHDPVEDIRLILDYQKLAGDVRVSLHDIEDYREIWSRLLDGRLDIACGRKVPANKNIQVIEAYISPIRLLMGQSNPLARRGDDEVVDCATELADQTMLFVSKDSLDEAVELLPESQATHFVEPNKPLLFEMLSSGDCVFAFPEFLRGVFEDPRLTSRLAVNYPLCGIASLITASQPGPDVAGFVDYWQDARGREEYPDWIASVGRTDWIDDKFSLAAGVSCPYAQDSTQKACKGCRWAS